LEYLNTHSSEEIRERVKVVNDPYEAAQDAHAIAILTEWDEFKTYDWEKIHSTVLKPGNIFDGRNILDKEALKEIGFNVYNIGK
ncbi:UDP binding domain-containing protein, partial [Flammeovirga agarivorans]